MKYADYIMIGMFSIGAFVSLINLFLIVFAAYLRRVTEREVRVEIHPQSYWFAIMTIIPIIYYFSR